MNLDEAVALVWRRSRTVNGTAEMRVALVVLLAEYDRRGARLAEFERTRSTGGPAPAETRAWANEQHVPPPETAHDEHMAVPARYQRSDAHLRDRREDTT